jgi:hypothetical protein
MSIWQLGPGSATTWHRIYTFENPITNNEDTVDGFAVTTGDISGDGRPEVLVFFAGDGSAGPGTYRLFVNDGQRLRQPLVKRLSQDEGTISFGRGVLLVAEGVDGHFSRSPHCCYRKVRTTLLGWNQRHLVTLRHSVRLNHRGWPPG